MENLKYPFHWKMNTLTHFKDGYRQHFQFQSSGNEWAGVWPGSGWDASVSLCTPALTPIPASCYCNSGEAAETESCYPRGRQASGIPASPCSLCEFGHWPADPGAFSFSNEHTLKSAGEELDTTDTYLRVAQGKWVPYNQSEHSGMWAGMAVALPGKSLPQGSNSAVIPKAVL